jgi:hypothetical protein
LLTPLSSWSCLPPQHFSVWSKAGTSHLVQPVCHLPLVSQAMRLFTYYSMWMALSWLPQVPLFSAAPSLPRMKNSPWKTLVLGITFWEF